MPLFYFEENIRIEHPQNNKQRLTVSPQCCSPSPAHDDVRVERDALAAVDRQLKLAEEGLESEGGGEGDSETNKVEGTKIKCRKDKRIKCK